MSWVVGLAKIKAREEFRRDPNSAEAAAAAAAYREALAANVQYSDGPSNFKLWDIVGQ